MNERPVTTRRDRFAALRREVQESFEDGPALGVVRMVRWLYPPWWFWNGFVKRWLSHDCDKQPITCHSEFLFSSPPWMWLDV